MTPDRMITAETITSGEKHDGKQLQPLVDKSRRAGLEVEAVIGDGSYSEKDNLEYAEIEAIKLVSKLSKSVTHGNGKNKEKLEYNKDDVHLKHMDYMASEEFQELYSGRYKIEAKNGELKTQYGYDTAKACGLLGITIQGASTLFLANMKRIMKLRKEKSKETR